MKPDRVAIHAKYGGHCAYCGTVITLKEMQVDHIRSKRNFYLGDKLENPEYGLDDIRNLNPACRVCNNWKTTLSIEQFRHEIGMQPHRCRIYSRNFRMAERYGLVMEIERPVRFYFEKLEE